MSSTSKKTKDVLNLKPNSFGFILCWEKHRMLKNKIGKIITFFILKLVDMMVGLRVAEDEETEGLDIVLHNERGYNI